MKFVLKTLFAVYCFTAACAFAGDKTGNGGNGIRINGKLYVLDLVEAGVETTPYFNSAVAPDPAIKERIEKAFVNFTAPSDLIAQKLTEIQAIEPQLALSFLKAIEAYSWRIVHKSLIEINDEDSDLDYSKAERVQLAVRSGRTIMLEQAAWKSLSEAHKAALITHEVAFALVSPDRIQAPLSSAGTNKDSHVEYMKQNSKKSRQLNGYLYTKELEKKGLSGLLLMTGYNFWTVNGAPVLERGNKVCKLASNVSVSFQKRVAPYFTTVISSNKQIIKIDDKPGVVEAALTNECKELYADWKQSAQFDLHYQIITTTISCVYFGFKPFTGKDGEERITYTVDHFIEDSSVKFHDVDAQQFIGSNYNEKIETCVSNLKTYTKSRLRDLLE
jgi:hypothetical protein